MNLEAHNGNFSLEKLHAAQAKTKTCVHEVAARIRPGIKESEAYKLMMECLRDHGARKFWHPIHVRFGSNTLLGYRETADTDLVLQDEDIFFFDIGPVFDGHEGDYGETFQVGQNPEHQKIRTDVHTITDLTRTAWASQGLSGEALYAYAQEQAMSLGWHMHPPYVQGHRISSFPHSLVTTEKLGTWGAQPAANAWILEIQIRHPEKLFGAFFEDILL